MTLKLNEKPNGAVLVVGAGIAGLNAAEALADSGYHVYLLEQGRDIGGQTARLDRLFPANDCAV